MDTGLNLARKWRSKQFDELVGQKLVVRTIKNSLYRNLLFPVYLFSGTKGCGKTTMARLFSAALNCQRVDAFRKNPQQFALPCLECFSCKEMQRGQHPDFIEIDAASHTGVDNVRHIIDAASFVPALGTKKIYLIDEAHMLSKAAFNALLKVLEEPPPAALFILATTDPHKVIDTVRSRCFQLFFHPLTPQELLAHLQMVCDEEKIAYELSALEFIAYLAQGSARDALNLIERVRLVHPTVSKKGVQETVGSLDDEHLIQIFKAVLVGNTTSLLKLLEELNIERYNTQVLWKKYVDLLRAALWVKQGVELPSISFIKPYLIPVVELYSIDAILKMLELCYSYELTLAKTTAPHIIFEMVLLKMCSIHSITPSITNRSQVTAATSSVILPQPEVPLKTASDKPQLTQQEAQTPWSLFLIDIERLDDPLVTSIFKQGTFCEHDQIGKSVKIMFSKDLLFFQEWLQTTKSLWQPILETIFKDKVELNAQFTGTPTAIKQSAPTLVASQKPVTENRSQVPAQTFAGRRGLGDRADVSGVAPALVRHGFSDGGKPEAYRAKWQDNETTLTITDKEKWPRATALLKVFPGKITYKASRG